MAEKLWAGRTDGALSRQADDFNSSIHVDSRMYAEDIEGSIAHATMLAECGILTVQEVTHIIEALKGIKLDMSTGALSPDPEAEDIHMFIEAELTRRIGEDGKKLHTARSRNDQVALDLRLYLRGECAHVIEGIKAVIGALTEQAEQNREAIMPGYTHLQRAQPILFAQHLLAYVQMLMRDCGRVQDAVERMNYSPLGSCALSGTTYPTNRARVAELLGFDGITENSMDGVSDRDFAVELLSAFSILMMHLSRLSEELILWTSWEFRFVELDDAYTTGSSIMPQKKNSDMAELIRGKTGRVYGDLMGTLTMLKGLPLAYNKDMQEDKESIFDALDTVKKCLSIMAPMLRTMHTRPENMLAAAKKGFINATDLADYLTKKGIPFRTAYKVVGGIVGDCIAKGLVLEDLPLEAYKGYHEAFEADLYEAIDLMSCIDRRISAGGTGRASVEHQIELATRF